VKLFCAEAERLEQARNASAASVLARSRNDLVKAVSWCADGDTLGERARDEDGGWIVESKRMRMRLSA